MRGGRGHPSMFVVPAKAGTHFFFHAVDSRLRGNDGVGPGQRIDPPADGLDRLHSIFLSICDGEARLGPR